MYSNNNFFKTKNWQLSELMMPKIKNILGNWMFSTDVWKDQKEGTDLLFDFNVGFALRIRTFNTFSKFNNKDEFTVRVKGKYGKRAELYKLLNRKNKMPKYGFYGFINEDYTDILYYTIYDISILRNYLINNKANMIIFSPTHKNTSPHDLSEFKSYKWSQFPTSMILAQGYNDINDEFMQARETYLKKYKNNA